MAVKDAEHKEKQKNQQKQLQSKSIVLYIKNVWKNEGKEL